MAKERFLTVLVPITDEDVAASFATTSYLPSINTNNVNKIYKVNSDGKYRRLWFNQSTGQYEYRIVVDREFPYLGKPLEIFDFTYDATRMGQAPTISAQNVMWFAEKDSSGNDVTLEDMWTQDCHVTFNGENFYLKQIPTSSKSNEDERYKYDLDFVSERVVLETVYLYDVVQPFITEKPISENATFNFYGDVAELAKRINASLIKSGLATLTRKYVAYPGVSGSTVPYLTYEQWGMLNVNPQQLVADGVLANAGEVQVFRARIFAPLKGDYNQYLMQYIYANTNGVYDLTGYQCVIGKDEHGNNITTEEKLITFEKNTIHEALQRVFDDFELQYYVEKEKNSSGEFTGNTKIWIADCQHDFADWDANASDYIRDDDGVPTTTNPLDYGVDDALMSKEKANTTDKIVTRITGVGSEENIPWYYPNPTADGWISPMLKTLGVEQTGVVIDYPTSEGSTVADATRYEKYLKNRIGNIFQFGKHEKNYGFESFDVNQYTEQPSQYISYLVVNVSIVIYDVNKLITLFSAIKTGASVSGNCHHYKVEMYDNNQYLDEYVSNQNYTNPTDFQTWCKNHNGQDTFSFSSGGYRGFLFSFYTFGMPLSQKYDFEGYFYAHRYETKAYAEVTDPTTGVTWHIMGATAHIGANFYAQPNLQAVFKWTYPLGTWQGSYYLTQWVCICGYSSSQSENNIKQPMTRVKGKNYKAIQNNLIYKCNTSNQSQINGNYANAFNANPNMDLQEWIETFAKLQFKIFNADSWYLGGKAVLLADYGINGLTKNNASYSPSISDTIEFKRVKYITPQPNLMPEVYVKTDGERRFYNAHNYWDKKNNTLLAGTADPMIGEVQDGTKVRNPLYKQKETDTDSKHYEFENEYIQEIPHEHIEDFEDVKPTITGQKNYIPVSINSETFAANKTSFFYKNGSGVMTQCTALSSYSSTTQYYALLRIDVADAFAYDQTDNDEIWESTEDGNIQGEYKHPYLFAKLRPLGFNLFDLALQDDMVISMTTGHCGACNFKIAVDENTKKNPVQLWEYDVYGGETYDTKGDKLYSAGDLRRYVDTRNLYYDTDGTADGYIPVTEKGTLEGSEGWLENYASTVHMYRRYQYSAEQVEDGLVGNAKNDNSVHFEGDVVTSGRFIDSQQDTTENFVWIALMKDTDTYGTLMPSARPDYGDGNFSVYIRPSAIADVHTQSSTLADDDENADKFVLVNIRLPQVYLRRAERDLSRKLIACMYDNNYQKFNFSIKFSRIFLAQNENIDALLNENSVLYVSFNNKTYRQYVKHYAYKMTRDAVLPEITVDMNDTLPLSRTYVEQQAAMQYKQNKINQQHLNATTHKIVKQVTAKTIGKNDTTIISGNIINKVNKTSFAEMGTATKKNQANIVTLRDSMETEHYKRKDFKVENGSDLNIGGEVFLPTLHKSGGVLARRRWDYTQGRFVADASEVFAPAFIDNTNKRLMDYHGEYQLLTAQPDDWATNYGDYYKLVNGVYTALTEAETFAANTYYKYVESVEQHSITPARVSGKQIAYGASGVLKPLYMSSNTISEKNYELLTVQPDDWDLESRNTYYMKDANGDYIPVAGSPTFAANTFYKEVETEYDLTATEEYENIVGAIDQIDVALRCASVTITPNQVGGYDGIFEYQIHPVRQSIETEPDTCPVETSDFWFRTTTE